MTSTSPTMCSVEGLNGRRASGRGLHALAVPPPWLGRAAACPVPSLMILEKQGAALAFPLALLAPLALSFAISAPEHGRRSHGCPSISMATGIAWSRSAPFPLSPAGLTTTSSSVSPSPSSALVAVHRRCHVRCHCRRDDGACGLGTLGHRWLGRGLLR
jgi:hypothetical protein